MEKLTKSQTEALIYIGKYGPISSLCCHVHMGSVKALIKRGIAKVSGIDYDLTEWGKKEFKEFLSSK